jgi:hypothetical protein
MAMATTTEQRIQVWMLMRGLGPDASLFFPSVIVTVEEDEAALFSASVVGFENRMVAMGYSEHEAAKNAISLFRGIVDNTLEKHRPLSEAIGSVYFSRIPYPVTEAKEIFQIWEKLGMEGESVSDDWRALPTNPEFMALAGLSA